MKRLTFWLILLFIIIGGVFYVFQQTKAPLPPVDLVIDKPVGNEDTTNPLNNTGTGITGDTVSGAVDDTELPLDQQGDADDLIITSGNQESDPEVDEIINILEELIAESETTN